MTPNVMLSYAHDAFAKEMFLMLDTGYVRDFVINRINR